MRSIAKYAQRTWICAEYLDLRSIPEYAQLFVFPPHSACQNRHERCGCTLAVYLNILMRSILEYALNGYLNMRILPEYAQLFVFPPHSGCRNRHERSRCTLSVYLNIRSIPGYAQHVWICAQHLDMRSIPEYAQLSVFPPHSACISEYPNAQYTWICAEGIPEYAQYTWICAAFCISPAFCMPKQTWEMRWEVSDSRYCSFILSFN